VERLPGSATERQLRDLPFPALQSGIAVGVLVALAVSAAPAVPAAEQQAGAQPPPPVASWDQRETAALRAAADGPGTVSFAVLDSQGREVAASPTDAPVPAASTIKALILVAYLRAPKVAGRDLTQREEAAMARMITASSNSDASRLLKKVGWPAVRTLAKEAGIADGFTPDQRQWGLSTVTAHSLATFFHELPALVPVRHRVFATGLFGQIIPAQQWGMADAAAAGWDWHAKAGWISSQVNQVGTFTRGADEFTVAITIAGPPGTGALGPDPSTTAAVQTLEAVTEALFDDGEIPGGSPPTDCATLVTRTTGSAAPRWAGSACGSEPDGAVEAGAAEPRR
jgi:hypothetical protein